MSTPNYWDREEEDEDIEGAFIATSAEGSTSKPSSKFSSVKGEGYKADKKFSSKKEIMTLDQETSKFPSLILPSINNQHKAHVLKEVPKYSCIE